MKIAKLQGPFGPFYADAPKVQAAVSRAERLATLLEETRAREADDLGAAWLIGRAEEMATFVDLILERWRFEGLDAENASVRIGAYLDAVQEGLEIHFGRTRSCSDEALITTAIPDPPSSRLAHALGSGVSEPRGRRTDANDVTAIDVDPTELVAFTPPPPTPTSPL